MSTPKGNRVGSKKTFTITPGTVRETLLGTPLTLPTAEPTTGQFSYTIQASDLPTISPIVPMKFNAALYASGKIGAAASALNFRILKNGVNVFTGPTASAAATNMWGHTHWRTFDVREGDLLEVRYWAAQADVILDFHGLIVYPAQPVVSKQGTKLEGISLSAMSSGPNFAATINTLTTNPIYVYPLDSATTGQFMSFSVAFTLPVFVPMNGGFLFKTTYADATGVNTFQYLHATRRDIQKQWFPQTISFREIRLG